MPPTTAPGHPFRAHPQRLDPGAAAAVPPHDRPDGRAGHSRGVPAPAAPDRRLRPRRGSPSPSRCRASVASPRTPTRSWATSPTRPNASPCASSTPCARTSSGSTRRAPGSSSAPDGHVFGDLIGVPDAHIDAYADALRLLIAESAPARSVGLRPARRPRRPAVRRQARPGARPLRPAPGRPARRDPHRRRRPRPVPGITRFLVEDTAGSPAPVPPRNASAADRPTASSSAAAPGAASSPSTTDAPYACPSTPSPSAAPSSASASSTPPDAWTTPLARGRPAPRRRHLDPPAPGPAARPRPPGPADGRLSHFAQD